MISTFQKHAILLMSTLAILARCQKPDNSLVVSMSEKPDINELIAYYEGFDRGGNTSVDHDADVVIKGSAQGGWGYYDTAGQEQQYYKRNRDLGQTFRISGTEPSYLKSITVRTGFGSNVVRPNIYGKALSLQILEVEGDAVLNDNGTDSTMSAFHGFPGDRMGRGIPHERDDYYTGETYHSMGVFSGGTFPSKTDFGIAENEDVPADHPKVKGRYLKFVLPENSGILLHPGRHYAFLVMIDELGLYQGFTLANNFYGEYEAGHGIRRDGNGLFPPPVADPTLPHDDNTNAKAFESARFPADFTVRAKLPVGTDGYPDVDTWRDLEFYVEGRSN